jgi:hypothetical protein
MKRNLVRALFALLLAASLVSARHAAATAELYERAGFHAAVAKAVRERATSVIDMRWGYTARLDGCNRPLIVAPDTLSLQGAPVLTRNMPSDYTVRFHYIEGQQATVRDFALYAEWLRQTVLATLGLTPYVPLKNTLVIGFPPECEAAARLDWRSVWAHDQGPLR